VLSCIVLAVASCAHLGYCPKAHWSMRVPVMVIAIGSMRTVMGCWIPKATAVPVSA
jgi:hypothetical protein